jgi:hypothetical protein
VLNTRHAIAQTIARELIPAEKEVESAILRNARLTIAVVEGRKAAKMPLEAGQDGLQLIAQASASLVEARGLILSAHKAFRQTQSDAGLDCFSYGDVAECPPPAKASARLKSVA